MKESAVTERHFLTGEEFEREELQELLASAEEMHASRNERRFTKPLADRMLAMIFEKPSLRTRVSFTVAMNELGGSVIELNASSLKHEEPEDTIRVLEGYCDAVMLRTFHHASLVRMASVARVPVINGLSEIHHPCQALADLLTLKQNFGKLDGLKLAYIGDGNNVLHSLLLLAPLLGVEVRYACPEGFAPEAGVVREARLRAIEGGGFVRPCLSPIEAATGANALYTDVWTSMGFEAETAQREAAFMDYKIDKALYSRAEKDAIIMHCLPMIREKEISSEMADHVNSRLFRQSENRLHAQKALLARLLCAKVQKPALAHERVENRPENRTENEWRRQNLRPV